MSFDEKLAARVREALADVPRVREKRMFGGMTFMVSGKMCVSVGHDRIMLRIDPALHDSLVTRKGVRPMRMGSREYRGYIFVNKSVLKTKQGLEHWLTRALDFNKFAKASKKRSR